MRKTKTSDGLTILNNLIGNDQEMRDLMATESENLKIAKQIYELRTAAGLSQLQLAHKINTTQSVISRLEDADYEGHSLPMLQRIARVLDNNLEVRFVPLNKKNAWHANHAGCAPAAA
jgi:ribosome-binding protein aMBF1 (putative translation factor)